MAMIARPEEIKEKIKTVLTQREREVLDRKDARTSAVLIPLFEKENNLFLFFTRRTKRVKYHKGQISFPGGEFQDSDGSKHHTALRETEEEVGLQPGDVEILGILDDVFTYTSNYIITPYIGYTLLPLPYEFQRNEVETAEMIVIPLHAFSERSSCRKGDFSFHGSRVESNYFKYENYLIWGATAGILTQFLEIAVWESD